MRNSVNVKWSSPQGDPSQTTRPPQNSEVERGGRAKRTLQVPPSPKEQNPPLSAMAEASPSGQRASARPYGAYTGISRPTFTPIAMYASNDGSFALAHLDRVYGRRRTLQDCPQIYDSAATRERCEQDELNI